MRRYELWIDDDGKLVLSEFRSLNAENESRILRGTETYNIIKLLSTKTIKNIKEKDDYLSVEFENYIININEAIDVLSKRGTNPLANIIKKYYETNALKNTKKKKVTRKNKHAGKKIVVTSIIIILILSTTYAFKSEVKALFDEEWKNIVSVEGLKESSINYSDETIASIDPVYEEITKVSIDYGDRSETDKAHKTKAYYGDLIEKYSKRYGVDSNLVLAIATQERGVHGTTIDKDGAIGLMQIQYNVWVGERISAYNFETGKRETFIVDDEKLADIDYNIKVGCMYLQNCMEYMDYNTVAAVQCYNMGDGNMGKILKAYSADCGKSVKEILSDPLDTGWLEYRYLPGIGDPEYIENVFSYLGEDSYIKNIKKDGTVVNININNETSKKIY